MMNIRPALILLLLWFEMSGLRDIVIVDADGLCLCRFSISGHRRVHPLTMSFSSCPSCPSW
ncbi:MAG: hypothetical protein WCI51_20980 [Lentisphaerota bacterium]